MLIKQLKNKSLTLASLLILSLFGINSSVLAEGSALSARFGTLGAGLEYEKAIGEQFSLRLGYNKFSQDRTFEESGVSYDGELKLDNITLLADYHLSDSRFRLTTGAVKNGNSIEMTGVSTGGIYTLNNVVYTSDQVGKLYGNVTFDAISPYLGIGWGNAARSEKALSFNFDLGVLFSVSPKVSLNIECGSAVPLATCSTLMSDVNSESDQLATELSDYDLYPVITVGLAYKF